MDEDPGSFVAWRQLSAKSAKCFALCCEVAASCHSYGFVASRCAVVGVDRWMWKVLQATGPLGP